MIYQLRFTESDSLSEWMKNTSNVLNEILPSETWSQPVPDREERLRRLKEVLWVGLRGFVTRRSLCGAKPFCDDGCLPVAGNLNPQRYTELRIHNPVQRFLVEGSLGISGMVEEYAETVAKELPAAREFSGKIKRVLGEALIPHLFENVFCGKEELCHHSRKVELPARWEEL
jgi:hypothetical protein